MIRVATMDDIDWMIAIAQDRYGRERVDVARVRAWLENALQQGWMQFLRGDHGFAVGAVTHAFYDPEAHGHMLFIAVKLNKDMEGYKLARRLRDWAFSRGAVMFHISSATVYNLEPFARRLGAVPAAPSFYIPRPVGIALERAA